MSRFRAWVVAVALGGAAGAAAPVSAAESGPPTDARPWYKKLFVSAPKPAGPTVRSGPVVPARGPSNTLPPDVVRAAAQAEADALVRRMDVCLKLRQAAFDKNDDDLMRQVDELERQAKAVYEARVAALGVPKLSRAPLPAPADAVSALDLAPEKSLDPKAAAAKLVAPAAPVPVSGTASAAPLAPESTVREVKP